MCSELLKHYGYRTETAATGIEAVDKARRLLPKVILMDLSLPGMDGWEATRRLKADEKTKRIPVVAVTGHALAGHPESAREAGCDFFLTKPVLPEALLAEVKRILSSVHHPPQGAAAPPHQEADSPPISRRDKGRWNGSPPERRE
jgi:CheY-like chemotaxis protein